MLFCSECFSLFRKCYFYCKKKNKQTNKNKNIKKQTNKTKQNKTTTTTTKHILMCLTAHNWQKWKRVFPTCPCHKIHRDEAAGLKRCKYRGERGELAPGANWHPSFCSRVCCQPMAMMFLCCTYTNQNTMNLWWPNPSWFKNYHDKQFWNHMSILF